MYAIDTQSFLQSVSALLHSLPSVGKFAVLIFALWLVSDSTRFLINAVQTKWLKPRAAAIWTFGLAAMGYALGGVPLALLTAAVAAWSLLASVTVRRFLMRLEFYRFVEAEKAKQKQH